MIRPAPTVVSMATFTTIGGPTVLIELGGTRFLVDPTFDDAGAYPIGSRTLVKTTDAAITAAAVGGVDAVLLSHDQHPDNLDTGGRAFVRSAPLTLTTTTAAERLGGSTRGLPPGESARVGGVTVTAVPAQHGPDGTTDLTGPVVGFVLHGDGLPTVYVSGDNASLRIVREVAERFPVVDIAVLFAGAARTPLVDGFLTLTSAEAVEAADILGSPRVLPVHTDGWAHFTEDAVEFRAAFTRSGMAHLLIDAVPGRPVTI